MTSLASSPIVPLATAALACALIIGTSYGGNSDDANAADDAQDAADKVTADAANVQLEKDFAAANPVAAPAAVAAPTTPTVTCAATACTVVFPIAGGTAKVFNTPFAMTTGFANSGGSFTLAGKKVVASKTKAGASPGYTVTISKADAASITAVVTKA